MIRATLRAAAAALLLHGSVACATYPTEITRERIRVESTPPGALIEMSDESGKRAIGKAPVEAEVAVEHQYYDFDPVSSWITAAITFAATGALLYLSVDPPDQTLSTGTVRNNQAVQALAISGLIIAGLSTILMVPALIRGHMDDGQETYRRYVKGAPTFTASLAGHSEAIAVVETDVIPPSEAIALSLQPKGEVAGVLGVVGVERREPSGFALGGLVGTTLADESGADQRPVIAVFDIDAGGMSLDTRVRRELSEYLAARITSGGRFRVVPRDTLRAQLSDKKKSSYQDCVDERCQIELGKAVAAEKSLSTRLIRVGTQCALTGTIFDLRTEAAESGESVRTECSHEALMDAVEQLGSRLAK